MDEWKLYEPDYSNPLRIQLFDDGLDIYKNYKNIWYIYGNWRGKIRLINLDKKTKISTISAWKVEKISSL